MELKYSRRSVTFASAGTLLSGRPLWSLLRCENQLFSPLCRGRSWAAAVLVGPVPVRLLYVPWLSLVNQCSLLCFS